MDRLLVTGATRFVGGHLLEELLKKDIEIIALVRSQEKAQMMHRLGVKTIFADLQKPETLNDVTKDIDTVIHLAVAFDFHLPWKIYYQTNVLGTKYLAEDALRNDVKHFIYTSTTEAMGPVEKIPADENAEPNPTYEYGKSKLMGEEILRKMHEENSFPVTILRPTGIFGPGDMYVTYSILKALKKGRFKKMPGGGDKYIQFTYVKDVVQGYIKALEKPDVSISNTYIISSDEYFTYKEGFTIVAELLGAPKPEGTMPIWLAKFGLWLFEKWNKLRGIRDFIMHPSVVDYMQINRVYSNEKAKKELGFKPKYSFVEGWRITIDWFRDKGLI